MKPGLVPGRCQARRLGLECWSWEIDPEKYELAVDSLSIASQTNPATMTATNGATATETRSSTGIALPPSSLLLRGPPERGAEELVVALPRDSEPVAGVRDRLPT
jgi:hypothetical protein